MSHDVYRFRAREGSFLYDVHSQRFAAVEHGATMATGFMPLFLSRLFGVPTAEWRSLLRETSRRLADASESERAAILSERRPRVSPRAALEVALLAYPSAERFLDLGVEPFALREPFAYQANVPLDRLEARRDGAWETVLQGSAVGGARARLSSSDASRPAAPGVYLTGHSSVLVRGERAGVLFDPVPLSPLVASAPTAVTVAELRASADLVALTHAHFDHYHAPSLLALDRPVVVPHVPRANLACEDMRARLEELGVCVRAAEWGTTLELDELRIHVLPFRGEQFALPRRWPDIRSWGNIYVVEVADTRVLIAADSGFEPTESVLDVVARWCAEHGPIDAVVAQPLGMSVTLGSGDADLAVAALLVPELAPEAFTLLQPSERKTLSALDVPALCRACEARVFVGYGQFRFPRGQHAIAETLTARVREAVTEADLAVDVPSVRIGEGLELPDLSTRVELSS